LTAWRANVYGAGIQEGNQSMHDTAILDRLRAVMRHCTTQEVDWDTVTPETEIQALGIDSLSVLDLIYEIQQEFDTEIEAEDFVGVNTVADVAALLQKRGV
jgi:acyl carrier protein